MKNNPIINQENFKKFLSKTLLKEEVLSIHQFARGASSFNWRIQLNHNKKRLVKLAWKHKKTGVLRLAKIINFLSNSPLPIAKIIPVNKKDLFKYKNHYGFLMEYINGASLPATAIKEKHINQILNAYKIFQSIPIEDKKLLIPAYDFVQIQKKYLATANSMLQKNKKHPLFCFLLNALKKELKKIEQTPLAIHPDKKTIIHGDFHHNNLLFKDEKLAAILDFEDLGYGYSSEDLIRFILCLTARYPLFKPRKKVLKEYLSKIKTDFDLSYNELMVGLNSFTLQKMKKIFAKERKPTFGLAKKMVQIIYFMRQYHFIKQVIKNLGN